MKKYEALSKAPKDVDVLKWWYSQSAELPIMYKIACHHLGAPLGLEVPLKAYKNRGS